MTLRLISLKYLILVLKYFNHGKIIILILSSLCKYTICNTINNYISKICCCFAIMNSKPVKDTSLTQFHFT